MPLSRRAFLAGSAAVMAAERPRGLLIDTHIHLFAADRSLFPYHKNAVYSPEASPVEAYAAFAKEVRLDGAVIVHPEPYQDDHSYLEYCFEHEPKPGFFKGTCLFDPIAAETPARMTGLVRKRPGRIVALRIHENRLAGVAPTTSGAIRDRDLRNPNVKKTWRAAHDLGLAVQMHTIPLHAPEIAELAREFSDTAVVIDHLARVGEGTPEQYKRVLEMAKLPKVYMKFSGPHAKMKPVVRQTYDAFGPDRMIWGGLGTNAKDFSRAVELFDSVFDFASEADRAKIRGLTAARLFGFRPTAA